jgi:hypothetical protein
MLMPGKPWLLAQNGTGSGILWNGWGSPDGGGVWSEARQAVILVHLPAGWQRDAVLDLEGGGFPARHLMRQTIIASVGERTLATVDLPPRATTFRVRVPADITVAKAFALILTMPHAGRPSDIANSGDMRLRGLYLRSITLERSAGEP